jgi:hypothetical protein
MTAAGAIDRGTPARRRWMPGQHGAWAMLAVPFLLGVAASRPSPWQLLLALTASTGYLASATAQTWLRSRRRDMSLAPTITYGTLFVASGLVLVAAHPQLLVTLVVLVPAVAVTLGGARPGAKRDLANSLAQAAQALVLVPAAAVVSGDVDVETVALMTAVAAAYLIGTVLVVRSVLRERDNRAFAAVSIGYHLPLVVLAAVALPWAWAVVAALLAVRAAALPAFQRHRAGTDHPLRPVQVGMVEIAASVLVVAVAFAVPL